MLKSQFNTLEIPAVSERDIITVDISKPISRVIEQTIDTLINENTHH